MNNVKNIFLFSLILSLFLGVEAQAHSSLEEKCHKIAYGWSAINFTSVASFFASEHFLKKAKVGSFKHVALNSSKTFFGATMLMSALPIFSLKYSHMLRTAGCNQDVINIASAPSEAFIVAPAQRWHERDSGEPNK